MKRIEDGYVLSTGKEFYANNGIIGIREGSCLFDGSDGSIDEKKLTSEEMVEIADYMIDVWRLYREGYREEWQTV